MNNDEKKVNPITLVILLIAITVVLASVMAVVIEKTVVIKSNVPYEQTITIQDKFFGDSVGWGIISNDGTRYFYYPPHIGFNLTPGHTYKMNLTNDYFIQEGIWGFYAPRINEFKEVSL